MPKTPTEHIHQNLKDITVRESTLCFWFKLSDDVELADQTIFGFTTGKFPEYRMKFISSGSTKFFLIHPYLLALCTSIVLYQASHDHVSLTSIRTFLAVKLMRKRFGLWVSRKETI